MFNPSCHIPGDRVPSQMTLNQITEETRPPARDERSHGRLVERRGPKRSHDTAVAACEKSVRSRPVLRGL